MRIVFVIACGVLFLGNATAWAADCSKGLLWPFARSAGECLTQTEKSQGMTGVYGGAGDAQSRAAPSQMPSVPQPNIATAPGSVSSGASISATPIAAPAGSPVSASAEKPVPNTASASCQKGWLWPFVREPGDCLTDQDRKNGIER
jgi:hypothetical protein